MTRKLTLRTLIVAAATHAVALLPTALPVAAMPGLACYSDWSAAAPVARKERLLTLELLSQKVADKLDGRLLKAVLCRTEERFVYRVVVKRPDGRLGTAILDAKPPER